MALITTTTTLRGFRELSDTGILPADPPAPKMTLCVTGTTTSSRLEPEHRVKPRFPVLSPTARATQSVSVYNYFYGSGWKTPKSGTGMCWFNGNAGGLGGLGWAPNPSVRTDTWVNPLRNQIKDLDISIGETVAEYRDAADMFHNAANGLWEFYRAVKRSVRSKDPRVIKRYLDLQMRGKSLKDLADYHLYTQLGVAPMISLGVDAYFNLIDRLNDPDFFIVKKFVQKGEDEGERVSSEKWVGGEHNNTLHKKTTIRARQRAVAYVRFKPGTTAGYTMGNPLELAWELTTLSFVIDWFITVGESLKALDALHSVIGVVGTVSYHTYTDRKTWIDANSWTENGPYGGTLQCNYASTHPQHQVSHSWSREVITSVPAPTFPRWKPSASWQKLATAVALFVQLRSS